MRKLTANASCSLPEVVDVVDSETRSRMMSGIRGQDTKPEMLIRRELHRRGFRYVLHSAKLPGRPDMVLAKHRAAIFVHGCFWHGHDCHLFKWPSTRAEFWSSKLNSNRSRDSRQLELLKESGWRVAVIWECAVKGAGADRHGVVTRLAKWIKGSSPFMQERG